MTHRLHHHYCGAAMKPSRTASIYPTVDEINALPEKFRQYIHDLETRCDKSGEVQTIALLREDRDALQQRVEELEARIAVQEREYRSPDRNGLNRNQVSRTTLRAGLCRPVSQRTLSVVDDRLGAAGATAHDVAMSISPRLAAAAIVARVKR
jgi:hypothetical protein